jgi:hypothetical protein
MYIKKYSLIETNMHIVLKSQILLCNLQQKEQLPALFVLSWISSY